MAKKTMTLNLTEAEMQAIEELAKKKDLSKTAVLRQALRLYQMIDVRTSNGDKLSSRTTRKTSRRSFCYEF